MVISEKQTSLLSRDRFASIEHSQAIIPIMKVKLAQKPMDKGSRYG